MTLRIPNVNADLADNLFRFLEAFSVHGCSGASGLLPTSRGDTYIYTENRPTYRPVLVKILGGANNVCAFGTIDAQGIENYEEFSGIWDPSYSRTSIVCHNSHGTVQARDFKLHISSLLNNHVHYWRNFERVLSVLAYIHNYGGKAVRNKAAKEWGERLYA